MSKDFQQLTEDELDALDYSKLRKYFIKLLTAGYPENKERRLELRKLIKTKYRSKGKLSDDGQSLRKEMLAEIEEIHDLMDISGMSEEKSDVQSPSPKKKKKIPVQTPAVVTVSPIEIPEGVVDPEKTTPNCSNVRNKEEFMKEISVTEAREIAKNCGLDPSLSKDKLGNLMKELGLFTGKKPPPEQETQEYLQVKKLGMTKIKQALKDNNILYVTSRTRPGQPDVKLDLARLSDLIFAYIEHITPEEEVEEKKEKKEWKLTKKSTIEDLLKALKNQGYNLGLPEKDQKKLWNYLVAVIKKKNCDPVENQMCDGKLVCDISNKPSICVKPKYTRDGLEQFVHNGQVIVGVPEVIKEMKKQLGYDVDEDIPEEGEEIKVVEEVPKEKIELLKLIQDSYGNQYYEEKESLLLNSDVTELKQLLHTQLASLLTIFGAPIPPKYQSFEKSNLKKFHKLISKAYKTHLQENQNISSFPDDVTLYDLANILKKQDLIEESGVIAPPVVEEKEELIVVPGVEHVEVQKPLTQIIEGKSVKDYSEILDTLGKCFGLTGTD